MMPPMLITFEGGEGAGKTTQINALAAYLQTTTGRHITTTREPGGTDEAEKIRSLLVERDGGNWDYLAETLLFFTARHMHIKDKIRPALKKGHIVICDRFTDSTIAYQGYGHGFDLKTLENIQNLCIGDFQPDLTFLLDVPVETGLTRAGKRLSSHNSTEDRFEKLDIRFHERLRQGFLSLAAQSPERIKVIDAEQPQASVTDEILKGIDEFI